MTRRKLQNHPLNQPYSVGRDRPSGRSQDPFGIRSILAEYSAQEQPNLAEKGLILAIDRLLRMKVPGHAEWPVLPLDKRCVLTARRITPDQVLEARAAASGR